MLLALAAAPALNAQQDLTALPPEELAGVQVYSASKSVQRVIDAPGAVTIVTAEEIQAYGYRTLADVLSAVRGVYFSNDRNYAYAGVRGFARPGDYNTRILLLIDGHRMNDNVYGMAYFGYDLPLDIDLIERVEVVSGPTSSLYGTGAFLGVVNVVTRRARDLPRAEVAASAGSFRGHQGRVSAAGRSQGGAEVAVSMTVGGSHGPERLYYSEFDSPATNHGIAQDLDGERWRQVFLNLRSRAWTVQALYGSRWKQLPTAAYGAVFNAPGTDTVDAAGYIDLSYDKRLGSDWSVLARGAFDLYDYDGSYVYDDGGGRYNQPDLARGRWLTGELMFTRRFGERHRLDLGGEVRGNLRQDQSEWREDTGEVVLDDRRSSVTAAAYLQTELALTPRLALHAGLRWDHSASFGETVNPRAALIYRPGPRTAVKLVYGRAFRAPNVFELYYWPGQVDAPALRPEVIHSLELAADHYVNKQVRLTGSVFRMQVRDLIGQTTDPLDRIVFGNERSTLASTGFEAGMEGKWRNGWRTRLAYTFTEARDRGCGHPLSNSPHHLLSAQMVAPLVREHLSAGLVLRYVSSRGTLAGSQTGQAAVADLTLLARDLGKRADLSASVYNVFHTGYAHPASGEHVQDVIPQDGRTFRVKLTFRF